MDIKRTRDLLTRLKDARTENQVKERMASKELASLKQQAKDLGFGGMKEMKESIEALRKSIQKKQESLDADLARFAPGGELEGLLK